MTGRRASRLGWAAAAVALAQGVARAAPPAASAEPARFAVVIGNNRPEDPGAQTLRYADDDAVATHRLLVEAGVRSVLLARLDDDTRRFQPGVAPDGPPRGADFDAALGRLFSEMRLARARGRRPELLFFYSGHGDVADGEGYVLLEDRRLLRRDLYALLARSPAERNHVFVDACKSYFLAFERGPGAGQRISVPSALIPSAEPARLGHVGFVLSTSSDRDSHEWERLQGGVVSHELRSALRGAADANFDGRLTYAELGAFVARANQGIDNPRFRPDVLVRAPDDDLAEEVLSWRAGGDELRVPGGALGHLYLENGRGERVADAHAAPGQMLLLHAPPERPLFLRTYDGSAEHVISERPAGAVSALEPRPPLVAARGALQLAFESFFALPFGPRDIDLFQRRQAQGVARERAAAAETARAEAIAARVRTTLAVTAGVALVGGLAASGVALERTLRRGESQQQLADDNQVIRRANLASVIAYAAAAVAGGAWAFLAWRARENPVGLVPTAGGVDVSASFAY